MADESLRSWLVQENRSFVEAFSQGDLQEWVVCVGNEAGDLDTLSCSIAFAYLSSCKEGSSTRYIPVQLTPSSAFQLRAENIAALKQAVEIDDQLSDLQDVLICYDTLDFSKFTPFGAKYALVDHNRVISSIFGAQAEVVGVIDHHDPEANNTLYASAHPRIIQVPTGSCASLVTNYFAPSWQSRRIPIGLANLLLSAIIIDTANLKPMSEGGKATDADLSARNFLLPRSRFTYPIAPAQVSSLSASDVSQTASNLNDVYKYLSNLKSDVSRLDSTQLLQRDYKQYEVNGWRFGLSTVPIGLTEWVHDKEAENWQRLLAATNDFGLSAQLDAVGILTSFKLKKKIALAENKPRHAREILILIRNDGMAPLLQGLDNLKHPAREQLDLSPLSIQHRKELDLFLDSNKVSFKAWKVSNASATRKQVAPILTVLVANLEPKT